LCSLLTITKNNNTLNCRTNGYRSLPSHIYVIVLALIAALLFSLGNQTSRRALDYAPASQVTLYQIGVSVTLYWMATPFYMKAAYWLSPAVFLLAQRG